MDEKDARSAPPSPEPTIRSVADGSTAIPAAIAQVQRYPKSLLHKCHVFDGPGKELLTIDGSPARLAGISVGLTVNYLPRDSA